MTKYCVLFNPKAGNGQGARNARQLCEKLGEQVVEQVDVTSSADFSNFFSERSDCSIVLCGGDGTLNRFANDVADLEISNPLFYCATGTGNDFLRDIGKKQGS